MSGPIASITEQLGTRLGRGITAGDRARARLHLLDWIGCALAGARELALRPVQAVALLEGAGPCRVIGLRAGVGPQAAALANGPPGAILEMDDVDKRALLHPGPVVIPAALAAAQAAGVTDGDRLLDAIVIGYEAMIRIGRATGAHYRMFHATATCGTFGAAAAAGHVIGLDAAAMTWAMGNAGQQAAGLWQVRHEPVFTKALHDGRAAANGVAAALLAREGFAGPRFILEGPQGFFAAMCPEGRADAVLEDADGAWAIHAVSFKPHAACRHAHAAIDAALAARAAVADRPVTGIEVATYGDALTFCRHAEPATPAEAKFSLAHAVAVALVHGDAGLDRFTDAAIAEPAVAALRRRVLASEDAAIAARYPARFGARITIRTADGDRIEAAVDDALGDPERPLDASAIAAKARALMAWAGVDPAVAEKLIGIAMTLGDGADLRTLDAGLEQAA